MISKTAGVLHARRLGVEGLAVGAGQAVSALGLLGAVRILSTLLSPAEYGTFALGLTLALLSSQMLFGPIANSVLRFYAAAEERGELSNFWAAVRNLGAIASIIGLGLAALLIVLVNAMGYRMTPTLAVSATAFAILSGWETVLDYLQSAQRRRWTVAWHQAIRQLLRPAIAAALMVLLGGDRVAWAFTGYGLASALVVISQLAFTRDQVRFLLHVSTSDYWDRLTQFALPFTTWGLFTWAQLSSDRWALDLTNGAAAVGLYAVLMQLGAQPVILLGTAAAQLFEPFVYARAGIGADPTQMRSAFVLNARVTAGCAAAVIAAVLIEWVGHSFIFGFVVAPQYGDASPMLPLAALSGGLFTLGQLFAVGSVVLGTSRQLVGPKIAAAVLGIALNIVGAHWFGVVGVVTAGVVTALAYGCWIVARSVAKYYELAQ